MKVRNVLASRLSRADRLDSWYFLSPGSIAAEVVARIFEGGIESSTIGTTNGLGKAWTPNRFKRAYASPGEDSAPYLRPYDVFEYNPLPADLLSVRRTKKLHTYQLAKGMILQTCSGRNLGPAVYVDEYLARFALSHDMVRIEIKDEETRYFVLSFLQSPTGQALLRRDKSGSVIDHITDKHVSSLPVPLFTSADRRRIADLSRSAVSLRQKARLSLDELKTNYEKLLPPIHRRDTLHNGWSVRSRSIQSRIDAASFDPLVADIRRRLKNAGGHQLSAVADVLKPAGRYKTRYVDEAEGSPLLSGAQILQSTPINLQFLNESTLTRASRYRLSNGWIVYQADGRAEESLGQPAMVTSERDGWLASGHVGRVVPNDQADSGWLYLALSTSHVQLQIKSLASGSVVDSTFPEDMLTIVVPPRDRVAGKKASDAWELTAKARTNEVAAIQLVEQLVSEATAAIPRTKSKATRKAKA